MRTASRTIWCAEQLLVDDLIRDEACTRLAASRHVTCCQDADAQALRASALPILLDRGEPARGKTAAAKLRHHANIGDETEADLVRGLCDAGLSLDPAGNESGER